MRVWENLVIRRLRNKELLEVTIEVSKFGKSSFGIELVNVGVPVSGCRKVYRIAS